MPTSRQTEKCDRSVAQSTHCSYGAVSADPEAKAYFHAKMVFGESVRLVPLRGDAMMFRVVPGAQELLPGHRVVVRIVAGLFGSELLVQRRTFGRRGEAYRLLRKWRTRGYLFNDAADVRPYMCSMS